MPLSTIQPGFENGFYAPGRGGVPRYPSLWDRAQQCYAPCLGLTGAVLRDWGLRGRNSTITNTTVSAAWTRSRGYYGFQTDGSDDYATSVISSSTYLSVTAWCQPFVTTSNRGVVAASDPSLSFGGYWSLGVGSSVSRFSFRLHDGVAVREASDTSDFTALTWYHIGAVYDRANIRLFVNGILKATTAAAGVTVSSIGELSIGSINAFGGPFQGRTDDVRIYDRPLSMGEMKLLARRRGAAYELDRTKTRYGYNPGPISSVNLSNQMLLSGVN